MNGYVEYRRAILEVRISKSQDDVPQLLAVWVDTAFDGFLVFPHETIAKLKLQQEAATEAILADGSCVTLESYICYVDWFGSKVAAQVIANQGQLPLLGTELLAGRKLLIDYVGNTVSIE